MMQCNDIKKRENQKTWPTTYDMVGEDHAAYVR
jgi:hypothetical protein